MWCLRRARLVRWRNQGLHVGQLRAELHASVLDTGCDGSSAQPDSDSSVPFEEKKTILETPVPELSGGVPVLKVHAAGDSQKRQHEVQSEQSPIGGDSPRRKVKKPKKAAKDESFAQKGKAAEAASDTEGVAAADAAHAAGWHRVAKPG